MSRPLRSTSPTRSTTSPCAATLRERVYRDDSDRARWQEILSETVERFGWLVLAYCQMSSHYHLLVETPQPNLSRGMRQLNGVYAQWFNRRHERVGHFFQARFQATLVERDKHLLVPLNPVRARLFTKPTEWRWSSYRATIGLEPPGFLAADRLLSFFADDRQRTSELVGRR